MAGPLKKPDTGETAVSPFDAVKALRDAQQKLNRDLTAVLNAFTAETSLTVTGIDMNTIGVHGNLNRYMVETRVELGN